MCFKPALIHNVLWYGLVKMWSIIEEKAFGNDRGDINTHCNGSEHSFKRHRLKKRGYYNSRKILHMTRGFNGVLFMSLSWFFKGLEELCLITTTAYTFLYSWRCVSLYPIFSLAFGDYSGIFVCKNRIWNFCLRGIINTSQHLHFIIKCESKKTCYLTA